MDNRAYMYGYTNNTMSGNGSATKIPHCRAVLPVSYPESSGGVISEPQRRENARLALGRGERSGERRARIQQAEQHRVFGYIGQFNHDFRWARSASAAGMSTPSPTAIWSIST